MLLNQWPIKNKIKKGDDSLCPFVAYDVPEVRLDFELRKITLDAFIDQVIAQRGERQIELNPVESIYQYAIGFKSIGRTNVLQFYTVRRCNTEHIASHTILVIFKSFQISFSLF